MNYKTYGTDAFLCKISTKRPILGRLIDVLRQGGTDVARINFYPCHSKAPILGILMPCGTRHVIFSYILV